MPENSEISQNESDITTSFLRLLYVTSGMATLLIIMGGIVCATDASQGCPDWPGCYGAIVPPPQIDAVIEYLHRLTAAVTTPLIAVSAYLGWRDYRSIRWIRTPLLLALVLALAVVVFGAFAVLTGLPRGLAAIDLGSALLVLAFVLVAMVVARGRHRTPDIGDQLSVHDEISRLAFWSAFMVYLVLVGGVLVSEPGSMERCVGWPIFGSGLISEGALGWLQIVRRLFALAAGILVILLVYRLIQASGRRPYAMRFSSIALVSLFLAWLLGWGLLISGLSLTVIVIYVAAAVILYSSLVILATLTALQATKR